MEEQNIDIADMSNKVQDLFIAEKCDVNTACNVLVATLDALIKTYSPEKWVTYNRLGDYFKVQAKDLEEEMESQK